MFLTPAELAFLQNHGLAVSDVLDGTGLRTIDARVRAVEQKKLLLLGNPCRNAGHRLRTSGGHCAQCDPRKLAYVLRYWKKGYVYIAGSIQKQLIKVGGTESIEGRAHSLQKQAYAQATDWKILVFVEAADYGKLESRAHTLLRRWATTAHYEKEGKPQAAREIYRCDLSTALEALATACGNMNIAAPSTDGGGWLEDYQFGND